MAISSSPGICAMAIACGMTALMAKAQAILEVQAAWDQVTAAQYLDDRIDLWFEKTKERASSEGQTSCISCHTVVPYLLARPALRKAMQVREPTPQEVRLLEEVARQVNHHPSPQSSTNATQRGERGTEAVLDALILARHDAQLKRQRPSQITRQAFQLLWATQRADGGWDWMDFAEEPDESADSQYYGAALAAIAVGTAAGMPGAAEEDTAVYVDQLRAYLKGRYAEQSLYNRTWMLLASSRLEGLLDHEQRQELISELRAKQNSDGGWSLYKLGPWKWSKVSGPFAPPGAPDRAALEKSDGYATGLIAYALRHTALPPDDPTINRAIGWLKANQKEVRIEPHVWHCWRTLSLNHDRENGGARGGDWKQMLMSDSATAFAVLALAPLD